MTLEKGSPIEVFVKNQSDTEKLIPLDELPPELLEIAEKLSKISGRWNPVELVTPSIQSKDKEKEKVFAAFTNGTEYNPVFEYPTIEQPKLDDEAIKKTKEALGLILHEIRKLKYTTDVSKPKESQLEKSLSKKSQLRKVAKIALYYKVKDDLATLGMIEARRSNNDALMNKSIEVKYPKLDKATGSSSKTL